jgi:predicted ester cyclase
MWNTGNVDIADEILSPDFVDRSHPQIKSIEMMKESVLNIRTTLPDFTVDIETLIGEGNVVALEGTVTRIQKGVFTTSKVMWFARVENGRMMELRTGMVNHS